MKQRSNQMLDAYSNRFNLEISASAYVRLGQEWHGKKVCTSFSRLYYVKSGKGWLRYDGGTVHLVPGKMYWIPPGVWLDYGCDGQLDKLFFHLHLLRPNQYDLLQGCGRIAQADIPEGWLEDLLQLQEDSTVMGMLLRKTYLYRTLTLMMPQWELTEEGIIVLSENAQKCISYIHTNLRADLRVTELAKLCFLSTRYLTEQFVRQLGVTPGRYIDDQLILEAQRRLSHSQDSVSRISEDLGFADAFYFSRKFKNKCGMTPLQYRKKPAPDRCQNLYRRKSIQKTRHSNICCA